MSDLIKNLRFIATREAKEGEYHVTENIDWMAADEIERLTALVKVLESDDHEWYLQAARIESLTRQMQTAVDDARLLTADNEQLRAVYDAAQALAETWGVKPRANAIELVQFMDNLDDALDAVEDKT